MVRGKKSLTRAILVPDSEFFLILSSFPEKNSQMFIIIPGGLYNPRIIVFGYQKTGTAVLISMLKNT